MNFCSFGEQHATALGQMYEECGTEAQNATPAEKVMDEYNNARGIEIAQATGCDINNLIDDVLTAYNTGVLHDIAEQGTP